MENMETPWRIWRILELNIGFHQDCQLGIVRNVSSMREGKKERW